MSSFTELLNSEQLKKVVAILKKYQASKPNNTSVKYFYKYNNLTITIFTNNKLLIQGNDAETYARNLLQNNATSQVDTLTSNYIGCDEVGVGDYFGGLVTCAVYLEKNKESVLRDIGVKDSKELDDMQMVKMVPRITKHVKYICTAILPEEYNALVAKYKNTHMVKSYMHDLTIKRLVSNAHLSKDISVVMDQYADRLKYYDYFKKMQIANPYPIARFETKAEKRYLAVAAASIIARVAFLEQIAVLSNKTKMPLLLGASNPKIIEQAENLYRLGGEKLLKQFVKIDFATTKRVMGCIK